jgi:hypothetical protein
MAVMSFLAKIGRRAQSGAQSAAIGPQRGRGAAPVSSLPRTQDQVVVVAARDNVLVLRDHSVVAAIGISSIDDALLPGIELQAKLNAFRDDLLKRLRFDFQILIGTRPQDLDRYHRRLEQHIQRLARVEELLHAFGAGLEQYLGGRGHDGRDRFDVDDFSAHFGFAPDDLAGIPGMAHEAAWELCQDEVMRHLAGQSQAVRQSALDDLRASVEHSAEVIVRWQDLLCERSAHIEALLQSIQAPVRTLYLVTSHNPRLITKTVARSVLSEAELLKAREELDRRCSQLARGIERMKLPAWRASHDELLNEVRHFYHPSQVQLARKQWKEGK